MFSTADGQRLAAFCFGVALKDLNTSITAITEYTYDFGIKLLVGTATTTAETGLLTLFDIKTSKILKSIELPYQVQCYSI